MKITAEIFKNCLYYIGPGKDFEPLLRFSNQCKYFLYANLYQSKDEVLLYIDQYFQKNDYLQLEEIKVYDDFDELKYFELHPQYHNHLINAVFLNEFERRGYKETFYHALNDKQWMIRIQVLRKDVNRKLTLFYFTGEGLASYIALSQNGQYPPKILCTIQTGALEHPDGIMPKLFEHTRSSPEQWVRGFEGEYGLGLLLGWDNNTLTAEGEFNTVGMDFMFGWNAEGSFIHLNHSNYHTARYCKNFVADNFAKQIIKKPFKQLGNNRILYGNIYDFVKQDYGSKKLVIVSRYFDADKIKRVPNTEVLIWNKILGNDSMREIKISMKQSMNILSDILKSHNNNLDKVYFIPYGLEDEGILLKDFLLQSSKPQLVAVVNRPLDFIDLRDGD